MFENLEWIRSQTDGEPIALWAQNAHVRRAETDVERHEEPEPPGEPEPAGEPENFGNLGRHLAATDDDRYVAVGFDFGGGGFRSIPASIEEVPASDVTDETITVASIAEAWPAETVPADDLGIGDGELARPQLYEVLRDVDGDGVVVDLRDGARTGTLGVARSPHLIHSIGSLFPAATLDNRVAAVRPEAEYDGLVYVSETAASVPLTD